MFLVDNFDNKNRELTKIEQLEWYRSYLEDRIARYLYLLDKTKIELEVEKKKVKRSGGFSDEN